MRRFAAMVAGMAAVVAAAAEAGPQLEGACEAEYVAVNFWPQGHHALGKTFPKYLKPHAEVSRLVKYGNAFVPSGMIAFADAYGRINLYPPCQRTVETSKPTAIASSRTIRVKANVTCAVPGGAHVQVQRLSSRLTRIVVIDPPRTTVLRARFAPKGSSLSYGSHRCKRNPPPF